METYTDQYFKVYTGKRVQDKLLHELQCGYALKSENQNKPYYEVRLWMLDRTLYVCRNKNDLNRYTVFAKMIGDCDNPTFQEPVGYAEVSSTLKTHMEIQLTFPRQRIFLSLFPSEK